VILSQPLGRHEFYKPVSGDQVSPTIPNQVAPKTWRVTSVTPQSPWGASQMGVLVVPHGPNHR
jgi:hypothetical protein